MIKTILKLSLQILSIALIVQISTQNIQAQDQQVPCNGADLNQDGVVNIFDMIIIAQNYLQTGTDLPGDINKDDTVNIFDMMVVAQNFLTTCSWTSTPTPTPNTSSEPTTTPAPITCGENGEVTFEFTYDGNAWTEATPGYCTEILVTNNTNEVLPTWTMMFDLHDTLIGNMSWGDTTLNGTTYTVTPKAWSNDNIPTGESKIAVGFCAYLHEQPTLQYPQISCVNP